MGRYLRNGFIQAALIVFSFLLSDLLFRMPPTIGELVTDGILLMLALAFAFGGIRAVRKTPLNDDEQQRS
jgi:hypothetical protein